MGTKSRKKGTHLELIGFATGQPGKHNDGDGDLLVAMTEGPGEDVRLEGVQGAVRVQIPKGCRLVDAERLIVKLSAYLPVVLEEEGK